MSDETKLCIKCGVPKLLNCFRVFRGHVRGECKKCAAAMTAVCRAKDPEKGREAARKWAKDHPEQHAATKRAWRQKNPDKQEAYARKTNYGITDAEFQFLLTSQKGVCAICGGPPTKARKNLSVDHCHTTGRVRGLLCGSCNTGLGSFKDNRDILLKALAYIFLHS